MSVTPIPPSIAADPEPFGLMGVRQFFWPAVMVALLCVGVFSAVMWYRSQGRADGIAYNDGQGQTFVHSVFGRIMIGYDVWRDGERTRPRGWSVNSGRFRRRLADQWPEGFAKTIGIQFMRTTEAVDGREGWWLRVKWYVPAILFTLPAVVWAVRRRRRGMSFFESARE